MPDQNGGMNQGDLAALFKRARDAAPAPYEPILDGYLDKTQHGWRGHFVLIARNKRLVTLEVDGQTRKALITALNSLSRFLTQQGPEIQEV